MKIRYVGIILMVLALICGTTLSAGIVYADSTPVLLLSGKFQNEEIVVDVTLKNNEGISAMTLSLEYDTDRIVLTGVEREKSGALSTLELMTTNTDTEQGYAVYPFKLNWFGEENDASNGKLLTLHFKPINDDVQGKAHITFTYTRGHDINYISGQDVATRNVLIDVLNFDISKGGVVSDFEHDESLGDAEDDNNTALAVGLALGGTAAIVIVTGVPMLMKKRKKIA